MQDLSFLLKGILAYLFYPSTLIFLFLLLVTIYVVLGKRRGRRRFLLFVAVFLYYISTTPFLPYLMLKNLERNYKVPSPEEVAQVNTLVVLAGRIYGDPKLTLEERFSRETLIRFLVGVELKRQFPKKRLIVVGGTFEGKGATYLKELAERFKIEVEPLDVPLDTIRSAKELKKILPSGEPFYLLTSAYHLPRAMFLFQKEGLNPIAYPTNFNHLLCKPKKFFLYIFPQDLYLGFSNLAFKEYLALTYYKIKYSLKRN
ncbi:MAG: YdcF family protein [Caldimicrobium sp.]|nr:YdcF family protein [Caldimicrobium sp.]MCX7873914.1 YdcF family protein [Caldimicrobium sp.]MDW8094293.1 YdcF family protein [Caldimicrobium sp.]